MGAVPFGLCGRKALKSQDVAPSSAVRPMRIIGERMERIHQRVALMPKRVTRPHDLGSS
jgi:hypothetical protein